MKIIIKRMIYPSPAEAEILAIFEAPDSHHIEIRKRANDLVRDLKVRDEAFRDKLEEDYQEYSNQDHKYNSDKALELRYALIGIQKTTVEYSIEEFKTPFIVQEFLGGKDITKIN